MQSPRGVLIRHPLIEQNHAVGHELLEAVAGQVVVSAAPFAGHNGRYPLRLQPSEQPAQLGAQDERIR